MKSRLIFSLSVALMFLSASVFSYSQEKPNTTNKPVQHKQVKQINSASNIHKAKTVSMKTAKAQTADKKTTMKTARIKNQKRTRNETGKSGNKKELTHHKRMEKNLHKKESNNTLQKK